MKKIISAAALITALLLVFTGCSNANPNASVSPSASAGASAETSASASPTISSVTVTVKGSDYVSALVTDLGTTYMASNAGITVSTTATNSNTAIASVADGTADIALSSRMLKDEEKTVFPTLKEDLICTDGLAVVVSKDCTLNSLTAQQVKDIFMGTITDWKDVGGAAGAINVNAMGSATDTRKRFNEQFLGNDETGAQNDTASATAATDAAGMVSTVGGDATAIGYMPLSAITSDSNVKALAIDGVTATVGNIKNGSYIYVLNYILITNNPSSAARAFVNYCKAADAQAVMATKGLIVP